MTANDIETLIMEPDYPCVAAKSAARNGNIWQRNYGDLCCGVDDRNMLNDISEFANHFGGKRDGLVSFVAKFAPAAYNEREFETAMWERLSALHGLDVRTHSWDARVSADPESAAFSFSLHGEAFFIIGLHADAERRSRQFPQPALVFNLHDQFEGLRADGKYTRMRDIIRVRDTAFCGSDDTKLRDFGCGSEARQYSGRAVEADWKCPFQALTSSPMAD